MSQFLNLDFSLHPQQALLLNSKATETLFGGSAGGGKSHAARVLAILWAIEIAGIQIFLFRRLYADLQLNHMQGPTSFPAMLHTLCNTRHANSPLIAGKLCDIVDGEIRFWNGSKIHLCHLQHQKDLLKYYGPEFHVLFLEEATQFTEYMVRFLRSRMRIPKSLKIPDKYLKPREEWRSEDPEYYFPRAVYTSNPGGIGHCVPYGEVLTPNGWKNISDFTVGDSVYTVTPSGHLSEANVAQIHSSFYSGDLIRIDVRGFKAVMTPNHRIAKVFGTKKSLNQKFSLVPFKDLPGQTTVLRSCEWTGVQIETFECPLYETRKLRLLQPLKISGDDYAELVGWFLSEGCTVKANKYVHICQSKKEGRAEIDKLLKRIGFKFRWSESAAQICSPSWWNYFSQFGKCRQKFIPPQLKSATKKQLRLLLNALMAGDGHWRAKGVSGTYYTISKQLADDVAEIAFKLGYLVYVRARKRKNRDGLSYSVSFKRVKSGGTEILTGNHVYSVKTKTKRRSDIVKERYDGPVYCLGIENTHSFVLRQDGAVWVSGNSYFKRSFIDNFKPLEYHKASEHDGGHVRQFVPARVDDNPSVNREQVKSGLAGLPAALVDAMLNGNWNAVVGAYFPECSPDTHVVPPFQIPEYWPRFMSMDWGACGEGDPFAISWWTASDGTYLPRGSLICYRRWYGRGLPKVSAHQVAEGIHKRESGEKVVFRVAGGDILEKRGSGPSIFEIFAGEGIHFQRADMRRVNGWIQVRERLIGKNEQPLLYWTTETQDGLELLGNLQHDANNPSDVAAGDDHCPDSTRYMCMARPFIRNKPPEDLPLAEKFKPPTMDQVWSLRDQMRSSHRR